MPRHIHGNCRSSPAGPGWRSRPPQTAPDAARAATRPPMAASGNRCRGRPGGSSSCGDGPGEGMRQSGAPRFYPKPLQGVKSDRLLDRLELVLAQISALEAQRDAVPERTEPADPAAAMVPRLAGLRGVGVQTATTLVREGFVRSFRSAKALGSCAGLVGTPFASDGIEREQGITRAGN